VIAKFIKDGLIKKVLTIYGDGNQTRDFIHTEDICNGIYLCLSFSNNQSIKINQIDQTNQINQKDSLDHIWGETFHLGTGKETYIINLAQYIGELFENNINIVFEPERKGEIKRNYSDLNKAKAVLGFEPKVNLRDGVREVYEWYMKQGIGIRNAQVSSGSEQYKERG